MNELLNHLDLDSIPFTSDGYDTNKSLRDLALEVIWARLHHRSKLAKIAKDTRRFRMIRDAHEWAPEMISPAGRAAKLISQKREPLHQDIPSFVLRGL